MICSGTGNSCFTITSFCLFLWKFFKCVLALLLEVMSVGWLVGRSVMQTFEMRKTADSDVFLHSYHLSCLTTFIFIHSFIHLFIHSYIHLFIKNVHSQNLNQARRTYWPLLGFVFALNSLISSWWFELASQESRTFWLSVCKYRTVTVQYSTDTPRQVQDSGSVCFCLDTNHLLRTLTSLFWFLYFLVADTQRYKRLPLSVSPSV